MIAAEITSPQIALRRSLMASSVGTPIALS
jgi:hypothetical protein